MVEQDKNQASLGSADQKQEVVLSGRAAGVMGIKLGMTQVYSDQGDLVPVTAIELLPNLVTQIKTKSKEGYDAVQVAVRPRKTQSCSKADKGHFKKVGAPGFECVTEFRVDSVDGVAVGSVVSIKEWATQALVDVTAESKGKGYQGGMKRYNMAGGFKTHGASLSHRSLGSIGNRADPAKCFKNKKMPGHMGAENVTVQNLKVHKLDMDNRLLLVRGSVPGPKNALVRVYKSVKVL